MMRAHSQPDERFLPEALARAAHALQPDALAERVLRAA
jgi:hypothetical protein